MRYLLPFTLLALLLLGCDGPNFKDNIWGNEQGVNREIDSLQTLYDSLDLVTENMECCDLDSRKKVLDLQHKVASQKYNAVLRKYEARHKVWDFKENKKKGLKKICCD